MKRFSLTTPAILLLTCIMSGCIMMVLVLGARAYQSLSDRGDTTLDSRTAQQYLMTKLRYQDASGMRPVVTDMDGNQVSSGSVLQCMEQDNGTDCMTVIYCMDGHVYELFTLADLGWSPGEGEYVLDAQSLAFEDTGKGIRVILVDTNGQMSDFYVGFRSGNGGGL